MIRRLLLVGQILVVSGFSYGCSDNSTVGTTEPDASADTDTDTNTDTVADTNTNTNTDTVTDINTDTVADTDTHALPLIQSENVVYKGAFKVPDYSEPDNATFAWAGFGIAYNPTNDSIYLTGHKYRHLVSELTIPTIVKSNDLDELNRAQTLQAMMDITEGNIANVGPNGAPVDSPLMGGLYIHNHLLYGTVYAYYEGAYDAVLSHFYSSLDLSQIGDFQGMFKVGNTNPGITAGYMTSIPAAWQSTFNAVALTGQACIPIIGRSSFGPSISTFSPSDLVDSGTSETTTLINYDENHKTLGTYSQETQVSPVFNMATKVQGAVFPKDTRSILFFGNTGLGMPEYGQGTDDLFEAGDPVPGFPDEHYVYDPAATDSKGPHSWPYTYYIWAYDAAEAASVYEGNLEPWEITPYAHWGFELPFSDDDTSRKTIRGVTYDQDGGRIFVTQHLGENARPVIHVLEIEGLN